MKLNIGENIRRLRRGMDMTQEQLADKLGVAYQSVSRWENGTTYPDMELLPALSGIFGVTVDELLGCEDSRRQELLGERFRVYSDLCYSDTPDLQTIIAMIRELRRDCLTGPALEEQIWALFAHVAYGHESIRSCPEAVEELRLAAAEVMEGNHPKWLKDATVEYMSQIEDDGHIEGFLDHYATERDLTKDTLLYERYRRREEWGRADGLRQKKLLLMIQRQFFGSGLWRRDDRTYNVQESLRVNTMLLNFIHNLCGVTPDPAHPITGDGSVDLFLDERLDLGIRRSCYLASTGDPEGAFVALEDTVSMLETAMSLPDGTMLTCKSHCLEDERFELRHEIWEENRPFLKLYRNRYGEADHVVTVGFGFPIHALTATQGWEWFDPIRNDPRYAGYVERVKAAFAPVEEDKPE